MDLAVLSDPKRKFKESEKLDIYLDLPREHKRLQNMRVTAIPITISELRTVFKVCKK